ncbi:MAG: fructose bisphosphate aldolase [Rhodobacteraceae bacterium]|nr:fructose bisphosphate aldolase [Paracoccaceae bacterium]
MPGNRTVQAAQMTSHPGFIAALDQSGGSTPKALQLYGIGKDAYASPAEMFDLIHAMRTRIAMAPAFTGDKVIGAILFDMTIERDIGGKPAARYLWEERGVVPFLKVDKGLAPPANGVQLMNPLPALDRMCDRAVAHGMFGTKMRAVINAANSKGIRAIVAQQFRFGKQILRHGLMPILEPEITITIEDKTKAEEMLLAEILTSLDTLPAEQQIMLKLSLPTVPNLYAPLVAHPRVMRVVALSGGFTQEEANARLAQNIGISASFSRALAEGLSIDQDDAVFHATIAATIGRIYAASVAGGPVAVQ